MTKKIKYRYIIGVASNISRDLTKETEYYVKYFYEIPQEKWEEYKLAISMTKNKVWKTTISEATKATNTEDLNSNLSTIFMVARYQQVSIHQFFSECKLKEEWFYDLPKTSYGRELLEKSRIFE